MKKLLILISAFSFLINCYGPKGVVMIEPNSNEISQDIASMELDTLEYELIVLDPGFELGICYKIHRQDTVHSNITKVGIFNM